VSSPGFSQVCDDPICSWHTTPISRMPTPIRGCKNHSLMLMQNAFANAPHTRMPQSPAEPSMMPWPFANGKAIRDCIKPARMQNASRMVLPPTPGAPIPPLASLGGQKIERPGRSPRKGRPPCRSRSDFGENATLHRTRAHPIPHCASTKSEVK
jgi:hypothetical protein